MDAGLDGFSLNFMSYPGSPSYSNHIRTLQALFAAAVRTPQFRLFLSFDQTSAARSIHTLLKFASHSNSLRHDGRLVVSGWGQSPEWVVELRTLARQHGVDLFIIPHMNYALRMPTGQLSSNNRDLFSVRAMLRDAPSVDGVFSFGAGGPYDSMAESIREIARISRESGKVYMAGISGFYRGLGANFRVFEGDGFEGMRARWLASIEAGVDWVQLVTWNDWNESTYTQPFADHQSSVPGDRSWGHLLDHSGYLYASRYYIDWFKSGVRPTITQERVFAFYRPHVRTAIGIRDYSLNIPGRPHGWATLNDRLFLVTFLRHPALARIRSGDHLHEIAIRDGPQSSSIPLSVGNIEIELLREGTVFASKRLFLPFAERGDIGNFNYLSEEIEVSRSPH
jgi:hypothetical protein